MPVRAVAATNGSCVAIMRVRMATAVNGSHALVDAHHVAEIERAGASLYVGAQSYGCDCDLVTSTKGRSERCRCVLVFVLA